MATDKLKKIVTIESLRAYDEYIKKYFNDKSEEAGDTVALATRISKVEETLEALVKSAADVETVESLQESVSSIEEKLEGLDISGLAGFSELKKLVDDLILRVEELEEVGGGSGGGSGSGNTDPSVPGASPEEVAELRKELTEFKESLEETLDDINGKLGALADLDLSDLEDLAGALVEVQGNVSSLQESVGSLEERVTDIEEKGVGGGTGSSDVDDLYYDKDSSMLYLTANGELVGKGVKVEGGAGGSSDTGTYRMVFRNLLENGVYIAATQSSDVVLKYSYTSIDENGVDDGSGIGSLSVNGTKKLTLSIPQGANELNITQYLEIGENRVQLSVQNSEGYSKVINYTCNVLNLSISSNVKELGVYSGTYNLMFTLSNPTADSGRTVHIIVDGREIDTLLDDTSNTTLYYDFKSTTYEQSSKSIEDGGHVVEVYAEASYMGSKFYSNRLTFGMIWTSNYLTVPAITTTVASVSAVQGSIIAIPYMVYRRDDQVSSVTLTIYDSNNEVYGEPQVLSRVDRDTKIWSIQDYPSGNISFEISCGTTKVTIPADIKIPEYNISKTERGLVLEFTAKGRNNDVENPAQWSYKDSTGTVREATFENFVWGESDGWGLDSENAAVLRFLPTDKLVIPYELFAEDYDENGMTIEMDLATTNVRDTTSTVLTCFKDGRGININTQEATLKGSAASVSVHFKEDSRVRIAFTIEKGLMFTYVNGVIAGCINSSKDNHFTQSAPCEYITVGADACGIDLYMIRIYNRAITYREQLANMVYDVTDPREQAELYKKNSVLNQKNEVSLDLVRENVKELPYMVITSTDDTYAKRDGVESWLPQYKGDKRVGYIVDFFDNLDPSKSFHATGCRMNVQGTSSAGYPVKNYKIDLGKSKLAFDEDIEITDEMIAGAVTTDKDGNPLTEVPVDESIKKGDVFGLQVTVTDEETGEETTKTEYKVIKTPASYTTVGGKYNKKNKYALADGQQAVKTFCVKADYASSENANNVCLVQAWHDCCPGTPTYNNNNSNFDARTPMMKRGSKDGEVRAGVYGRPMIMFLKKTAESVPEFIGKYNFNNDKSTQQTYGFDGDYGGFDFEEDPQGFYDWCTKTNTQECWELCVNDDRRDLFEISDFDEIVIDYEKDDEGNVKFDENGEPIVKGSHPRWTDAFEMRFPDSGDLKDAGKICKAQGITEDAMDLYYAMPKIRFKRLTDWIASTNQAAATNRALDEAKTYGSKTYTNDTKEYRLAKFKYEFDDYLLFDNMCYNYIWTEVFLMVDSRAKNAFMTTDDGIHWFDIPYDYDTAIGINNEGVLAFSYSLDDTDKVGSGDKASNIFNGQDSVLWINFAQAFSSEIKEMYADIRNNAPCFSYVGIRDMFNDHQNTWPEALWNEDAYAKWLKSWYGDPSDTANFPGNNATYLPMVLGDKESQRDWWLYNGFKYRDSKYSCGDALKYMQFRGYFHRDFTVTPYSDIYVEAQFGDTPIKSTRRINAGETFTVENPIHPDRGGKDGSDAVYRIYSPDRFSDIGDLSEIRVDLAEFDLATKLRKIKVGDGSESYENPNLKSLSVGNNKLLEELDVRNCVNLDKNLELGLCTGLKRLYAGGSAVPGATLPRGGHLEYVEFPQTVNSLSLINQKVLTPENIVVEGYDNLVQLRVEGMKFDVSKYMTLCSSLAFVRLMDVTWEEDTPASLLNTLKALTREYLGSIDADGKSNNKVPGYDAVSGSVNVLHADMKNPTDVEIMNEAVSILTSKFPSVTLLIGGKPQYTVLFKDTNTEGKEVILFTEIVYDGNMIPNPIKSDAQIPTKGTDDPDWRLTFSNWRDSQGNVFVPDSEIPTGNLTYYAVYTGSVAVRFMKNDTDVITYTLTVNGKRETFGKDNPQFVEIGGDAILPYPPNDFSGTFSDVEYNYSFNTWSSLGKNIQIPTKIYAEYYKTKVTHSVTFYVDDEVVFTIPYVEYGSYPSYSNRPVDKESGFKFAGWAEKGGNVIPWRNETTGSLDIKITKDTKLYAKFDSGYNEGVLIDTDLGDDWSTIFSNEENGTYASRYSIGNIKNLTFPSGKTVQMQIAAFNVEEKADGNSSTTKPHITWVSRYALPKTVIDSFKNFKGLSTNGQSQININPVMEMEYDNSKMNEWEETTAFETVSTHKNILVNSNDYMGNDYFSDIEYFKDRFYVAFGGSIYYTTNFKDFTRATVSSRDSISLGTVKFIHNDGSTLIAAGYNNGYLAKTTDGITFTTKKNIESRDWTEGFFMRKVVGPEGNKLGLSKRAGSTVSDGTIYKVKNLWDYEPISVEFDGNPTIRDIEYLNGTFYVFTTVKIGSTQYYGMYTSADGNSWTRQSTFSRDVTGLDRVVSVGGKLLCYSTTETNKYMTYDVGTFGAEVHEAPQKFSSIIVSGSSITAFNGCIDNKAYFMKTSNGTSWVQYSTSAPYNYTATGTYTEVKYMNNKWYFLYTPTYSKGEVYESLDCSSWTRLTDPVYLGGKVFEANGMYFTGNTPLSCSKDLINWEPVLHVPSAVYAYSRSGDVKGYSSSQYTTVKSIKYLNDKYVMTIDAGSTDPCIAISSDGKSWTLKGWKLSGASATNKWVDTVFSNGLYILVGNNYIQRISTTTLGTNGMCDLIRRPSTSESFGWEGAIEHGDNIVLYSSYIDTKDGKKGTWLAYCPKNDITSFRHAFVPFEKEAVSQAYRTIRPVSVGNYIVVPTTNGFRYSKDMENFEYFYYYCSMSSDTRFYSNNGKLVVDYGYETVVFNFNSTVPAVDTVYRYDDNDNRKTFIKSSVVYTLINSGSSTSSIGRSTSKKTYYICPDKKRFVRPDGGGYTANFIITPSSTGKLVLNLLRFCTSSSMTYSVSIDGTYLENSYFDVSSVPGATKGVVKSYELSVTSGRQVTVVVKGLVLSKGGATEIPRNDLVWFSGVDYSVRFSTNEFDFSEIIEYKDGTGSIGGWGSSVLREALNNEENGFLSLIKNGPDFALYDRLKKVGKIKKVQRSQEPNLLDDSDKASFNKGSVQTTGDYIWIPSYKEVTGKELVSGTTLEETNKYYRAVFENPVKTNESRQNITYWTRTAQVSTSSSSTKLSSFYYINTSGTPQQKSAESTCDIIFMFTT